MTPDRGSTVGRWSTAVALAAATLLLSAVDSFPLVGVSFAVLLLAFSLFDLRAVLFASAVLLWIFVLLPADGEWELLARGWALLLGGIFALTVLFRPAWRPFPRALLAVGIALAVSGAWLLASGGWGQTDWLIAERFGAGSVVTAGILLSGVLDGPLLEQFLLATRQAGEWRSELFPALLALQSVAALALAWWSVGRLRGGKIEWKPLRPLRDFRFNDQLVWLLVIGLLLLLFPLGGAVARLGANALVFMGGLYALRGIAVFVFLAGKAPSLLSLVFAGIAAVILYPLVLTAALLVGLGDTWLDVRGRTVLASRT